MNSAPKRAQAQVDAFNSKHPIGTPVVVSRDDGSTLDTTTRSEAYLLNRDPVIFLVGISGCYLLERVKARAAVEPEGGPP